MSRDLKIHIDPANIPTEPGCLSILIAKLDGKPVEGIGVPQHMQGAKWANTYCWNTLIWEAGKAYCCLEILKTESADPWSLDNLQAHRRKYGSVWKELV